ncbi:SEC-C metal-binding domain-containing protein [Streptomyces sp. NPDC127197]|uniref:SEC-C metal-binding domain-containing protein n=1 Tax=Streptomyces sp. NPDC127197 TaxID=3345388 RepID=UPI00362B7614
MSSKRHPRKTKPKAQARRKHSSQPASRLYASGAEAAVAMEESANAYLEFPEETLLEAASQWTLAKEFHRALAIYDRLLEAGCEEPEMVRAYRAEALWDMGRVDAAREVIAGLRARHPEEAGSWHYVAELLESNDEPRAAVEWFTAGITHALSPSTPLTPASVAGAERAMAVEQLVGHDDCEDLADELHEARASLVGAARLLDELHDPRRQRATWESDPEAMEDEINAVRQEAAAYHTAPAQPRTTCVLFWPPEEFVRLLQRWPKAARGTATTMPVICDRSSRPCASCRTRAPRTWRSAGPRWTDWRRMWLQTVDRPITSTAQSGYAAELARRGQVTDWPPPRNGPCWCGSERKYKKCCGNPASAWPANEAAEQDPGDAGTVQAMWA